MTDREKVVKGLECCKNKTCEDARPDVVCPYIDWLGEYETAYRECTKRLADDALSLLKTQEPRVMTLEELMSCDQETIWFEEKPNHTMKQLTQDGIAALVFIGLLHNWNGHGTVWRCWTAKPTDEQREVAKWDNYE